MDSLHRPTADDLDESLIIIRVIMIYFLALALGLPAARLVLYAMATAWSTGRPAAISVLTFFWNARFEVLLINGISFLFISVGCAQGCGQGSTKRCLFGINGCF